MFLRQTKARTLITLLLVFILSFIPDSSVYAAYSTDHKQLSTAGTLAAAGTLVTSDTESVQTYYKTEAMAKLKAQTLINSVYNEVSVQYALIDDGKIVLSGQSGVYSKDGTTPLTNNSMYGIGSVSKMFTTVAVMQLVDQGKVKLDKPVVNYIPEFKMADSRYKDITVRMLLNHSSGLMGSVYHDAFTFGEPTDSYNLLETLKTSRLKADPGEFSVYCNDGFTLAQILVEKVTGISFTDYIRKNISDPLSLNNTKTPKDEFQRDNLVKTYLPGSKNNLPNEALSVIGAGGIYSSAENLCRFAEIFMQNSTSEVLSAASVAAMENAEYLNGLWPADADSVISYGLGWDSIQTDPFQNYGITALAKGGDTLLYHASLVVLPEENMAMAVLSSGGASTYNELMAQEVLMTALQEKGIIKEILPNKNAAIPASAPMPVDMKKWEGIYAFSNGAVKVMISDDGTLTLKTLLPILSNQKFIYRSDGKFYSRDGSASISFVTESNGCTYLYVAMNATYPSLASISDAEYQAQRITDNPISKKVKVVWEKRDNKKYFYINEVYNSQLYALEAPYVKLSLLDELEGYFMNAAILDKNTARVSVKIPGTYGRDLSDYEFFTVNGTEYLRSSGYVLISEDTLTAFPYKAKLTCTLGADGYAKWYKIGKESANKKIKVTLPKASSFSVYNSDGSCTYSSTIDSAATVTLPSGGYIVFAGSPSAKFTVKYVN
ncbi:MAG TPA: serine hydrolase domain-containing protein [Mobilitalea sp.]|nr:serine hydrolase domain-containing protein [Mobilitalea sp.]